MKDASRLEPAPFSCQPGCDALQVVTIHHRIAPLAQLERMALDPDRLRAFHVACRERDVQAVALSTCNRTELYTFARRPGDHALAEALLRSAAGAGAPEPEAFARHRGGEATEHLFRVAAGLESLVLGEAEVLGQVRGAFEAARGAGAAGPFLSRLFQAALRVGGRVRSETAIGTGVLSVASASVRVVARAHGDLSRRTVLVVGAGDTGLKAARHLRAERVGRLVLLNRTAEHAQRAAAELGAEAAPLDRLGRLLPDADAVLVAVRSDSPVLTAELLRGTPRRRGEPLALVDLSLPRAIDPACAEVDGTTLHDLSDLELVVSENRERREAERPRVERLLRDELQWFAEWAHEFSLRPLMAEIRRRAEAIRQEELERALADGLPALEALERLTRRLVDRVMFAPMQLLREDSESASRVRSLPYDIELEGEPDDAVR